MYSLSPSFSKPFLRTKRRRSIPPWKAYHLTGESQHRMLLANPAGICGRVPDWIQSPRRCSKHRKGKAAWACREWSGMEGRCQTDPKERFYFALCLLLRQSYSPSSLGNPWPWTAEPRWQMAAVFQGWEMMPLAFHGLGPMLHLSGFGPPSGHTKDLPYFPGRPFLFKNFSQTGVFTTPLTCSFHLNMGWAEPLHSTHLSWQCWGRRRPLEGIRGHWIWMIIITVTINMPLNYVQLHQVINT